CLLGWNPVAIDANICSHHRRMAREMHRMSDKSRQSQAYLDSVPAMTPDLDGRVIAIAGAGGGLGPVVARRLADAGAILSLVDRHRETADSLVKDLGLPDDRMEATAAAL